MPKKEEVVTALLKEVAGNGIYLSEALRMAWDAAIEEAAIQCETTPVYADMCMEQRRESTKHCAINVRSLKK